MKLAESEMNLVAGVFEGLGGKRVEDSDGAYWLFLSGALHLEVEPFLRQTSDGFSIGIDVSISNRELSQIVNRICGKRGQERQQVDWRQWQQNVRSKNDIEAACCEMLQKALLETQAVGLADLVTRLSGEPPSERSLSQLMHLAALAHLGNVGSLKEYREGMETGRRFGFVPMITVAFLDRAIKEAVAREAQQS